MEESPANDNCGALLALFTEGVTYPPAPTSPCEPLCWDHLCIRGWQGVLGRVPDRKNKSIKGLQLKTVVMRPCEAAKLRLCGTFT